MKLAMSTADAAPGTAPLLFLGDICQNLKKAAALGYSAIEIHTRENISLDYPEILKTCNELDMRISVLVTGRLQKDEKVTLIDDDAARARIAVDGLKKYVDMARKLKSDVIIAWLRGVVPDIRRLSFYEKRLADNIKELAGYAGDNNVRIYIEGLNRYEVNYLNTARDIVGFIEGYAIPNTYAHLDTFHMNIEEANIGDAIRACAGKLAYIHFADSNRKYPGAGHIDFASIVKALNAINYKGYITVECLPDPNGEEAARLAAENIKSMFTCAE